MSGTRRWVRFWRRDPADDVRDEVAFHLDATIAEEIANGRTPEEAQRIASSRFGDVAAISDTLAQLGTEGEQIVQRQEWFEGMTQDLRVGLRQLRRTPGFTVVALLTLALGIGANTAIFSVIDAVLLRPLGFAEADRLLDLRPLSESGDLHYQVPYPNFLAWKNENHFFAAIGGTTTHAFTLTGRGDPQRLSALRASASYWHALEHPPVLGRYFVESEDRDDGPRVIVLSNAFWQNTFGGDPAIVGKTITLDALPYTVIGVASPAYTPVSNGVQVWVPIDISAAQSQYYGDHEMVVYGRLKPGVSATAATADLGRIEHEIQVANPDDGYTGIVVGRSVVRATVGNEARQQFLVLIAAVGLVLLIACGNVANLLLARAVTRRGEIAVRCALGANRMRIVRQLLAESGLLAVGGTILGIGIGAIGVPILVASGPAGIPRLGEASINGRALVFAAGIALFSALLFGLIPALRASRTDLQSTLRASGRDGRGSHDPLRGALVIAEIAIAVVLLIGAGLLIRSAAIMERESLGIDPANLLTTRISLPAASYPDSMVGTAYAGILARVAAIPGVTHAALISRLPIAVRGADCMVTDARVVGANAPASDAQFRSVSPGYFSTIGTAILRGRPVTAVDQASTPFVSVINGHLAHTLFADRDPIGQQIQHCISTGDGRGHATPSTVIGVAADVRANGPDQDFVDQVYYANTQFFERSSSIVVRSRLDAAVLAPALRRAVSSFDPLLPMFRTTTMDAVIRDATVTTRFTMLLLALLGVIGLVLSMIGTYGVIAYQVSQRTREVGVRIALGATASQVLRMIIGRGFIVALAGVAVGELVALALAGALGSLLYGVGTKDPVTFVSVGALLAVTAVAASTIPAWRATRIDPVKALRE